MFEQLFQNNVVIYCIAMLCFVSLYLKHRLRLVYKNLIKISDKPDNINTGNRYCRWFIKSIADEFVTEYENSYCVNNVSIFVDKYMYKVSMFGIKNYTWESLGILSVILCLLIGTIGAIGAYSYNLGQGELVKNVLWGLIASGVIIVADVFNDLQGKREQLHTNICNYLENYMKPRLERGEYRPYNSAMDNNELEDSVEKIDDGMRALLESMSDDKAKDMVSADDNIIEDIISEYLN